MTHATKVWMLVLDEGLRGWIWMCYLYWHQAAQTLLYPTLTLNLPMNNLEFST